MIVRLAGAAAELDAADDNDPDGVRPAAENFGALFRCATPAEREAAFSLVLQDDELRFHRNLRRVIVPA